MEAYELSEAALTLNVMLSKPRTGASVEEREGKARDTLPPLLAAQGRKEVSKATIAPAAEELKQKLPA